MIDEAALTKLEDHINGRRELLASVKCCYANEYQSQDEFRFLPGHKAMILGMRGQIDRMKESGQTKQYKLPKTKSLAKPAKTDDELKSALIKILFEYPAKRGMPLPVNTISERNIVDFQTTVQKDEKVIKCMFSCPFCPKAISIQYKNYWMSSNATKHLKHHVEEALREGCYMIDVDYIEVDDEFGAE